MKLGRSIRFDRSYAKAPEQIQRAFYKQPLLLSQNLQHPSLRAKNTTRAIQVDAYLIVDIVPHPK